MKNSYQGTQTSQVNIKTKNQLAKTFVSMVKLNSLDKAQDKIKKINYLDPLLSALNNSENKNIYPIKANKTEDFFLVWNSQFPFKSYESKVVMGKSRNVKPAEESLRWIGSN